MACVPGSGQPSEWLLIRQGNDNVPAGERFYGE
jgi:hypothetical protein